MSSESNNTALKNLRVLRQVFFLASMLIIVGLTGYFLGYRFFIALPILVALGLLLSSFVGWCPMIYLLEKAPWNRMK